MSSKVVRHVCTSMWRGNGLCNQLLQIINAVLKCKRDGKLVLVLDGFNADHVELEERPKVKLVDVFDFQHIQKHMYRTYGVVVVDHGNFTFTIDDVKCNGKTILSSHGLDSLNLPQHVGDPSREVSVTYSFDGYQLQEVIKVPNGDSLVIAPKQVQPVWDSDWYYKKFAMDAVKDCARNLKFHPRFHARVDRFMADQQLTEATRINVAHLRLETDMVSHLARVNKFPDEDELRNNLVKQYVDIIERTCDPSDPMLLLTGSTDNGVIDYLKSKSYKYYVLPKLNEGFNVNAIYDLIFGTKCNNVFIGCSSGENMSTFSLYLHWLLPESVKKHDISMHTACMYLGCPC